MRESDRVHSDSQPENLWADDSNLDEAPSVGGASSFALPFAGEERRKPAAVPASRVTAPMAAPMPEDPNLPLASARHRNASHKDAPKPLDSTDAASLARALTSVREAGFEAEDACFEFSGTMALDAHEANCLGKSTSQTHASPPQPQEARPLKAATPMPEGARAPVVDPIAPKTVAPTSVAPSVDAAPLVPAPRGTSNVAQPAVQSPSVRPEVASKIDPAAYAEAAARAEKKFQSQNAKTEAEPDIKSDRERMSDRLSGAIEAEKERERDARRIAVAAQKRAALVAERNDGKLVEDDMNAITAPKRKSWQRNRQQSAEGGLKKSLLNNAKSLGAKVQRGGGQLVSSAKALTATVPLAANKVATMTGDSVKSAGAGAVSASQNLRSSLGNSLGKNRANASGGDQSPPPASGDDGKKDRRQFGPILVGFGAVCSLLFVGMVSVWTYKLGQRDSMEVPIVKAMAGDARVRPAQSGGEQIAHQGLAVNEVLNGGGVAAVADEVMTAPRLRTLTEEDVPSGELQALIVQPEPAARPQARPQLGENQTAGIDQNTITSTPNADVASVQPSVVPPQFIQVPSRDAVEPAESPAESIVADNEGAPTDTIIAPQTDVDAAANSVAADANAELTQELAQVAQATTAGADPLATDPDVAANSEVTPELTYEQGVQVAMLPSPPAGTGSVFAPAMTEAPRARPADISAAMASAVDDALAAVISQAASEADNAAPQNQATSSDAPSDIPLPAGTRMIQLGAFDSAQTARTEWDRYSRQHGDLLSSKESYIQRIDNSGRIFYRLRVAGYDDREQTRAACAALSARGLPCITVTLR